MVAPSRILQRGDRRARWNLSVCPGCTYSTVHVMLMLTVQRRSHHLTQPVSPTISPDAVRTLHPMALADLAAGSQAQGDQGSTDEPNIAHLIAVGTGVTWLSSH